MRRISTEEFFENYTRMERRLPKAFWLIARFAVFGLALTVIGLLLLAPPIGLKLFWGVLVPILPGALLIAPGLWRQVCPMAMVNQIPRQFSFSRAKDLPEALRERAFAIAVGLFFVGVALRAPLLNHNGLALAIGLAACLLAPFLGGLLFKGRSGWCGTICPLAPIQRVYGQAPLVVVPNGYCPTCLGCQKTCYDFNPRAAIFSDIYDNDQRYAGQRRFYLAMMPGLILAYFLQDPSLPDGPHFSILTLFAASLVSAGLYLVFVNFCFVNPFYAANLFAAAALGVYYYFSIPIILHAIGDLTGLIAPEWVIANARYLCVFFALALVALGWEGGAHYAAARTKSETMGVDESKKSLRERVGAGGGIEIIDRESGVAFAARPDQSLLEAIEAAGLKINFGCRSGLCGADPVVISEGAENLSPPSEDELATLRRLGLEGQARLACVCSAKGPAVIDRDVKAAATRSKAPAKASVDRAKLAGLQRVVIIGNGVGGTSAAEALRRDSASLDIAIVTDESFHFYNRMALGRLIYGRAGMAGLHLLPDEWYEENRIDVWRNTLAVSIDRVGKRVILGTGDHLVYDKLVLATGARVAAPFPEFFGYANAFGLRTAADAQRIRAEVQSRGARSAVVIGGGVLGVEAADALHHLGLSVTILHRSGWLMDRQLDLEGAIKLTTYLQHIGIKVLCNAKVVDARGDKNLTELGLTHGARIRADIFIGCTGLAFNTDLAKQCGLAVGRGIKVDEEMRTSDPDIYAVGDVAEAPGVVGGLWPIAGLHAAVAAASIFGEQKPFVPPRLMVQLKCDGIDLRSFGDINCQDEDARVITAKADDLAWWRLVLRKGDVVGGLFVGPPGTSKSVTKLFQMGGEKQELVKELQAAAAAAERQKEAT